MDDDNIRWQIVTKVLGCAIAVLIAASALAAIAAVIVAALG